MSSPVQPGESGPAARGGDAVIFISHSSRDREIAQTITGALEKRGFRCWISSRDIGPGENFQEAIVRAIRRSRLMILVFTGHANNSNEIKKEMALASQNNLAVIPIRVEDVVPNDAFAYEFATRQWIDTFDNWEHAIERLSLQVGTVLRGGTMADALAAAAAAPPAPMRSPAPPASKRMAGLAVAALALLAVAAVGAYYAIERAPSHPAAAPAAALPAPAPQAAAPLASAPPAAAPAAAPAASSDAPRGQEIAADANRAYHQGNYDEAFRLYQQAAAQGLPVPEFWLGLLYHRGLGTRQDYAEAMNWYRKSADQGYGPGMAGVGQLYHFGQGVPQNFIEAQRWFRAAADKGAPAGMLGMGNLYEMGEGVPLDYAEAMRWYRAAADRNGPNAGYFIGLLYERGLGVPVNRRQARQWMRKAADLGSDDAQSWLATHVVPRDQ